MAVLPQWRRGCVCLCASRRRSLGRCRILSPSGSIDFARNGILRFLTRRPEGIMDNVTIPALQQMKPARQKIVGVVAWDFQIAQIVDRAGVDIVSVGDSVGTNLWGHPSPLAITMEEMMVVCKAVRRGVKRAIVSCDLPFGPLQEGIDSALRAAIRLVKEAGAGMVKLDGASVFPEAVRAISRAGIPVFAQFGITPQTALQFGVS